MSKFNKTKHIGTRVLPELHKQFMDKSQAVGKPSEVLRSLIDAFVKNSAETTILKEPK